MKNDKSLGQIQSDMENREPVNSALNTLLAGIDTEIKITLSRIRETNSQFFEGKLSGLTFCRDLLKKTS